MLASCHAFVLLRVLLWFREVTEALLELLNKDQAAPEQDAHELKRTNSDVRSHIGDTLLPGLLAEISAKLAVAPAEETSSPIDRLAADKERMIGALIEIHAVQLSQGKGLSKPRNQDQARVLSAVHIEAEVTRVALLCCLCAGAQERQAQLQNLGIAHGREALLSRLQIALQEVCSTVRTIYIAIYIYSSDTLHVLSGTRTTR